MIKLFRNIRKKLLEQGKIANYFKYAIGEIVLVVIGKTILCPVRDSIRVALQMKQNLRAFRYEILYTVLTAQKTNAIIICYQDKVPIGTR
ncbi:MAG: hypothetical protein CVU08_07465 [Bacteroidetes bacterium HGW-Bacteroidetes-3]|jgi:hypothetical protein|nr:MAG: hypothetical protein CVU08_07465 [Bacteroidetes bacterium HGW-Bacteroidetes-3]